MNIPDHGKYQWIPILYDFVKVLEPKKIVEFGPGRGTTTITMAKALDDNNIDGHINSYDWIKTDEEFDFLYFDINNTGEKLKVLYETVKDQIASGSVVFFEGGSKERDAYGHDGQNMYHLKNEIGYKILTGNVKYSASAIYNTDIYKLNFS